MVGVARDSKYIAVFEGQLPHMYFAMEQTPFYMRVVYVRSAAPPESLKMLVEREIHALDADMPIADARPLREIVEGGVGFMMFHIGSVQAGAMGVLGLVLAVVGVYGVVSYGASLRMREMGIRVALGASPADVRGLVIRQGSVLVDRRHRLRPRRRGRRDAHALDVLRARRLAGRPDVRRRHAAALRDRAGGVLPACPPRDARRSDDRVEARMTAFRLKRVQLAGVQSRES